MSFEKGLEYREGLRIAEIFASICVNQNIILNIIQVIFLNQNGIKTHIILIRVLFDPLVEESRLQALGHLRVKTNDFVV